MYWLSILTYWNFAELINSSPLNVIFKEYYYIRRTDARICKKKLF